MKKLIFAFICILALMPSAAAYAKEAESFEITGGVNFSKDKISTFDSSKTISGAAGKDTEIKIEVYSVDRDEMSLCEDYSFTVGISGIFTQTINLELGENFVVVSSGDGEEEKAEITINRINETVKEVLEKGVYLP